MSLFNINQVTILGNLIREAELKYTKNNTAVTNISVATNHSVKNGDSWDEVPTYHDIVVWGKMAEAVAKFVKGSKIFIQGRLQKRSYEKDDGTKVYITEIVAEKVIGLDNRKRVEDNPNIEKDAEVLRDAEVDTSSDDEIPF